MIAPSGDRIERLTVFPDIPAVLAALSDRGIRLGIISDCGMIPAEQVNQALEAAGILGFFEPALIVYGRTHHASSSSRRRRPARRLLFVEEDPAELAQALQADFLVAPQPRVALPVLQQHAPLR